MEHLIPSEFFVGLPQWALLLLTAMSIGVLVRGAGWLVDGASGLALRLGISKVIVGATIVSLGTTSPEAGVSVMAAWNGQPGLALGNAIGSIIVDTGLIFGLGCVMVSLPADRFVLSRQGWVQFGAATLLAVLAYGSYFVSGDEAVIGRWMGFLLVGLLAAYLYVSVRWSREHPHGEPFQQETEDVETATKRSTISLLLLAGVGLVLVLLASRVMILSVTELAEAHWHVPQVVIAATLVALGTSLPELVIGMASILKGHQEILVGNVVGADILNVLFVVGASAVAAPLPLLDTASAVPHIALLLHIPVMLLILVLFRISIHYAGARGSFRRRNGVPLLAIYAIYAVLQFVVT